MEKLSFKYEYLGIDDRLDKFLASMCDDLSRSMIQKLIKDGNVRVNDEIQKNNYILKDDDDIELIIPSLKESPIQPQNIPLDIVYSDDDIMVINKPSGMVVHPAPGNKRDTLVNALLYHCDNLSGINGVLRPGIVHRIDKDTSGLIIVCKNDFAHKAMSDAFFEKKVDKTYYCITSGSIPHNQGVINAPIGRDKQDRQKMAVTENGKVAITHFKVLERFANHTLLEVKLETGRTHQIRVHLKYIGYPIVGDPIYGLKKEISETGQYLHAKKIGFYHPRTNEYIEFDSELPLYFKDYLEKLRNEDKLI